jgi:uncharacterized protein YndB with AHSA1/START domain
MSVTSVVKDREAKTMTLTAEFDAPVERVWGVWADPRKLERWWGPPTYPATFEQHDLTPGGSVTYFMTGPEGDRPRGWWKVIAVDPPHSLEFEDGFSDESGRPQPDMPVMTMRVSIDEQPDGRTRMTIETTFPSLEAMDQLTAMGMEEGITAAVGQIDELLRAEALPA